MNDWFEAEQRVERALQLSEAQRWDEALEELDAALAINPHNPAWHAQRGYLLDELERYDDALTAYERSASLDPNNIEVLTALAVELTRMARYTRALDVLADIAKRDPSFEPAYCHRIAIYAELGNHETAEEMFYLAQELNDSCPHCFYHIGCSLADRGEMERALYCWNRVLELAPDYVGVNERIGQAYKVGGEPEKALDYFVTELRGDPGNTELMFQMAELLHEMNRPDDARVKLLQIIELDPDIAGAYVALGRLYLEQGEPEEALTQLRKASRLVTDDLREDLNVHIGEALLRMGKLREARKHLFRAADYQPKDLRAQVLLGHCLLASGKALDAVDCYRRVLAQDDDNAFVHNSLAACLYQIGSIEEGLRHCRRALELDSSYVPAMHHSVFGLVRLGHWGEARRMIRKVLDGEPDNEPMKRLSRSLWRHQVRYYLGRLKSLFGR